MKVLLSIFSVNEQILHIGKILKDLDCDVEIIYADSYRYICPYYMKKIDELGIHIGRNNYLESIHKKLNKSLHEFKPDVTLFINIPKSIFSLNDIKYINKHSKTICWLVDGIKGDPELCEYLSAVRQIYVFEYEDVSYLNSMNIKASYLPVGYNDAFFDKKCKRKDIDILFIGSPFYNRLELLEKVAFEANKNLWNLKIIGPFYEEKYPWKKMIFKKKYPYIFRYLNNTRVSSEEAAALYSRTKICLNIHDSHHKSPNPRTFEILAAKAFELIDQRDYWGELIPGEDLIEYTGSRDLIKKIKQYLNDDEKRNEIAENGYKHVFGKMGMKELLKEILLEV